ncbi:hypothetical protein GCM10017562_62200 [Streptomyces roseofulvus]
MRIYPTREAYRDWAILAARGKVWLRRSAGRVTRKPPPDVAWYNRHCDPTGPTFDSLKDGLREYLL